MQTWGKIPVRGTPMASRGAPVSQTHNSAVAGSGHEFYIKNAGKKGLGPRARAEKDKIAASVSKLRNQCNWFHISRSSR
jgi:hypothetical protein